MTRLSFQDGSRALLFSLAIVIGGCGGAPPVQEWAVDGFCSGTLETCEGEHAWNTPPSPADVRSETIVVTRHPVERRPIGSSVHTDTAMNYVRLKLRCAPTTPQSTNEAVSGGILDDVDSRCDLFVERARGRSYRPWLSPVVVGTPTAMLSERIRAELPAFCLAAIFLVVAVQQAVAALRGAQREGAAYVALVALSIAARITAQRRNVVGDSVAAYRVEVVAAPLAAFAMLSFLWWLCGSYETQRGRAYAAVCAFVGATLAFTPLGGSAHLAAIRTLEAFIVASAFFAAFEAHRARTKLDPSERGLLLIGIATLAVGSTFDALTFAVIGQLPRWMPMGLSAVAMLLFVFILTAVIAQRNALAHRRVEVLADDLVTKNDALASAAAELERTNEDLRRASAAKDIFVANTSHELRTPLHGIIGLVDITRREPRISEPGRRNLDLTLQAARRLNGLVADLLDFSRISHAGLAVFPTPVRLASNVEFVCDLLRPTLEGRPITLEAAIDEHLPLVNADPQRLQQIVFNLLGNALKFTKRGSIRVYAKHEGDFVTVFVRDTGCGISKDAQRNIFDAFEQGDGSTARESSGTGLGLAIVKGIVEAHGGRVAVQSTPGMGSTFSFTLKTATDTAATEDELLPPSGSGLIADRLVVIETQSRAEQPRFVIERDPTGHANRQDEGRAPQLDVMVVDDEFVNREVLRQKLEPMGHRVHEAAGGEEALEMIRRSGPPDLVLLDVMMPRITGLDVLRELRKTFDVATLPVILLTARAQQKDLVEGFEAGANDYVVKPFAPAELGARVGLQARIIASTRAIERSRNLGSAITSATLDHEVRLVHLERLAALGAALSGVAHDLVSPLHHVQSGIGLSFARALSLHEAVRLDEAGTQAHRELLRFLDVAKEGASAALDFASSLRDMARTGENNAAVEDISTAVETAIRLTRHKTKSFDVTCDIPSGIGASIGRIELAQLVMNLLGNAAESLTQDRRIAGSIRVRCEATAQAVELHVDDDGPGVPETLRERVFDAFFTTKPAGVGTGLGLAVCRTITQRAGGTLTCHRSPVLSGARFTVTLPRRTLS